MNTINVSDKLREKLTATFATLKGLGVAEVTFSFSGGGDEGSIEDTTLSPEAKYDIDVSELDSIAEELLDEYGYDWINGEGGYGEIKFLVESTRFTIDMNLYEVVANEFPAEGSLHG